MRKNDGACYGEVIVETVGGPKPVRAITGRHRVLGADGRFHKVKIIRTVKREAADGKKDPLG